MPDPVKEEVKDDLLEKEEVKTAIATAVENAVKEATEGLEHNRDAILTEKRELSDRLKSAEEQAKKFEGLDVDKIRTMIDAVGASEEAQMISEGKIDEVIAKRTASVKTAYEQQFVDKDAEIQALNESNSKLSNMYETKLIGDAIQAAALSAGMLPEAVVDAISNSQGLFKINEDGAIVASKADEYISTPERFIKELKNQKPYYWPSNADFRLSGSDNIDATDLGTRIETASKAGDFEAYKALRNAKKKS